MSIRSKKDLELELSRLKSFEKPSWKLEQYATPADIAAEWIWEMALKKEIIGKTILDAACGPGILGIGLLLMGAKKVYFLDKDEAALKLCQENVKGVEAEYDIGKAEFILGDVSLFDKKVDIVVQNPPFGTKNEHIDKLFLEKAFSVSKIVYSMHKYSTHKFVEAVCEDFGFKMTHLWRYDFSIKAAFEFHKKPVVKVDVGLWRMEKS